MKTRYIYLLIALFFITACEDPLMEDPRSAISTQQFYRNRDDALAAVNAAYAPMGSAVDYTRAFFLLTGHPADEAFPRGGAPNYALEDFTFDASNQWIVRLWPQIYLAISRSNIVINRVPDIEMNEELKSRIVAEGHFIRALNYFHLVRLFGGVPLRIEETTSPTETQLPRATAEEVYQLIISDLQIAERDLPDSYTSGDIGRATLGAAKALLAKVYLTREQWDLAAQKAEEVIESGTYSLFENYSDVFDIAFENGVEHIFQIQFRREGPAMDLPRMTSPRGTTLFSGAGAWEAVRVAKAFYDSYDDQDARKTQGYRTFYVDNAGDTVQLANVLTAKYADPAGIGSDHENNFTVLRYADVLLIFAEANAMANNMPTTEAYNAINQVRNRVNLDDLPEGMSLQEFRDAVIQERAWELAFESNRWFDLVRTGKLTEILGSEPYSKPVEERHLVFPLPQEEIDFNEAITQADQNSGY